MPYRDMEKRKAYEREYRRKRREAGVCQWCGGPTEGGMYRCPACRKRSVDRSRALKDRVIAKLGGKCACCGETERVFLGLDHINGGGNKDRQGKGPQVAYYQADKDPSGFQVLCHNCNLGRHINGGICPHQRER